MATLIYDNLAQIADRFDLFLFDAYGVFWEGSGFYAGSLEIMRALVSQGKTVMIVSNSTQSGADLVVGYTKRGMVCGRDYQYMLSSGDLLRDHLLKADIAFRCCPNPRKYFVIGQPHRKAFADTVYEQVATLKEADFVYCGVPFLYEKDVAAYPQYQKDFWPVKNSESENTQRWDTLTAKPFANVVDEAAALNLPVLNANPDFTAKEGHPLVPDAPAVFVVRNGTIAEMFKQRGIEVLEYGKPHANIYDYTFAFLQEHGVVINKDRTCMIGDTVRTDIKGAVNAGIVPILCVETGVTADAIYHGKTLKNLCAEENIDVKQIIQIKSVGGL